MGVFDSRSTNNSQLLAFKNNGHEVIGYNYRQRALELGVENRDEHLIQVVEKRNFDLVVFSKCDKVSERVFKEITKKTKTCLWFMDPLITYNDEMRRKTELVDYFCCDKKNVLSAALEINSRSYHICEGFDQGVDKPWDIDKEYDVSFIGNVYGDRADILNSIEQPVKLISSAYAAQHSKEVSKTKINLNFCTADGASDRVYKILAAGGFLLSNDWVGREKDLTDGKECVIFNTMEDLNNKIEYYLNNERERNTIAQAGHSAVQKFNRLNWANRIVELTDE